MLHFYSLIIVKIVHYEHHTCFVMLLLSYVMNQTQNTLADRVIRRTINKGTGFIEESIKPSILTGPEFKDQELERLRLTGDLMIVSGKGTTTSRLSDLQQTKIPDTKGHYISTGKGTGLAVL